MANDTYNILIVSANNIMSEAFPGGGELEVYRDSLAIGSDGRKVHIPFNNIIKLTLINALDSNSQSWTEAAIKLMRNKPIVYLEFQPYDTREPLVVNFQVKQFIGSSNTVRMLSDLAEKLGVYTEKIFSLGSPYLEPIEERV